VNDLIQIAIGLAAFSFLLDMIMKSYGSKNRPKLYVAMNKLFDSKPSKSLEKMSGDEFTEHVVTIFQKHFWESRVNLRKPDMGVDLFTTSPSGITYGIECKNWKNTVGNSVVRSVAGGKRFYQVKKAVVVSARSEFTKPAREQSRTLGVILIRFRDLEKWIENNS
jgi:HJR/Mrr/RecB family endonuclease